MSEHPIIFKGPMIQAILEGQKSQTRRVIKPQPKDWVYASCLAQVGRSPYGQTGDRLWCKEGYYNGIGPDLVDVSPSVHYRIDHPDVNAPWRSPLFMPRKYSRLALEITEIRVERVQDIGVEDARREGADKMPPYPYVGRRDGTALIGSFRRFWDSLNAKHGFEWGTNPWVWVISFRRIP